MAATDTKQSTWRQRTIDLAPKVVQEFVFIDTKPNHVLINNLGTGKIFMGISLIPSPTLFDMQVSPLSENLYAQDTGFTRIQLYSDGTDAQRLKITSFEHPFNPATIKPNNTGGGGGVVEGGGGYTGEAIITGFSAPLPSGSNNIGRVVVSEIPPQTIVFDTLPAGTNKIGRVDVDKLPALAAGVSHIGSVGIDGGVTISSMPPVTVSNEPVKQSHQTYEATVTTIASTFNMAGETVNRISFLMNEGTTDLFISFDDDPVTSAISSGLNKSFRLRAGESINDMPRKCGKVNFIRATGTGLVRFLGV
jgi:hypothetical protein